MMRYSPDWMKCCNWTSLRMFRVLPEVNLIKFTPKTRVITNKTFIILTWNWISWQLSKNPLIQWLSSVNRKKGVFQLSHKMVYTPSFILSSALFYFMLCTTNRYSSFALYRKPNLHTVHDDNLSITLVYLLSILLQTNAEKRQTL